MNVLAFLPLLERLMMSDYIYLYSLPEVSFLFLDKIEGWNLDHGNPNKRENSEMPFA